MLPPCKINYFKFFILLPYLLLTILKTGKPTIVITTNSPNPTWRNPRTNGTPKNLYNSQPIIKSFIIVGQRDAINNVYLLFLVSFGV